ncbi:hypothetical protein D3C84_1044640 [compost metagenome]
MWRTVAHGGTAGNSAVRVAYERSSWCHEQRDWDPFTGLTPSVWGKVPLNRDYALGGARAGADWMMDRVEWLELFPILPSEYVRC